MAYTGTKAITGKGTVVAINTGTASAPTWVPILESASISPSGYEFKTDEATNLASTAVERIGTLPDGGTWDVSGSWISTDPGQVAVAAAFGTTKPFKVTLALGVGQSISGDSFVFSAIVTKWSPDISGADKRVMVKGTLATTNGIVFTAGS